MNLLPTMHLLASIPVVSWWMDLSLGWQLLALQPLVIALMPLMWWVVNRICESRKT